MAIRSFLAFELPSEIRQTLSTVLENGRAVLGDIRWVRVENIHLTVVFMGDVREDEIGVIEKAAENICRGHAPFRIHVEGAGMFGSRRNPRVLWIGLQCDVNRMSSFRGDLQKRLAPLGIQEDSRPFKPHLTLGRFRKGATYDRLLDDFLLRYRDLESDECTLCKLVLFRSDLNPSGPVYTRLAAWVLNG